MGFAIKPCLLTFSLLLLFISATSSEQSPSVYDILPKYGLPSGLLPDCVQTYILSDNGAFQVDLTNHCYVNFDYLVYYDKRITGTLKYGSITDLKGIQVRKFLIWLDVDEIRVDLPPTDSIYFQVGIINKKLDLDQFNTVHSCKGNPLVAAPDLPPWKLMFQLPAPVDDEIQMLLTE